MADNKYITITTSPRQPASGKSKIWVVTNIKSGDRLGEIKWYGAWHQYCFYPDAGCIFNTGCMEHIIAFIELEMAGRRTKQ